MKKLFDARCPNGHDHEYWFDDDERETQCKECDEVATRQISAPRSVLDVCSGDFPGATAKWLRDRASKAKKERRDNT